MTLPSLKKHPITRLSRQVWTASLAGAAAILSSSLIHAQDVSIRYYQLRPSSPATIQLVSQEEAPENSPLDRLKERSAQQRFDQLQNEQTPAPLPLEEPGDMEPVTPADFPPPKSAPKQENKLPRLPELDELQEFEPFQSRLKPMPPMPEPPMKLVPAPAQAPLQLSPVSQDELRDYIPAQPGPPDTVRSLSDIKPYYDFESPRQEDLTPEGVEGQAATRLPEDLDFPDEALQPRLSPDSVFAWEASNLFSNPLYFEDPAMERYGHTHGDLLIQPLISMGRVSLQLFGMPYQSVIDHPHTKRYPLGFYRPGEPAPHLHYQIPLNAEAAAAQGLAITGAALIIP